MLGLVCLVPIALAIIAGIAVLVGLLFIVLVPIMMIFLKVSPLAIWREHHPPKPEVIDCEHVAIKRRKRKIKLGRRFIRK